MGDGEVWRPRQHEIDTEACGIFEGFVPSQWVCRVETPDYGIDRRVEVFEGGNKTGRIFAVQIKGKQQLDPNAETWKFSISTKQLDAYVARERVPVFLAVIDVTNKAGRWLLVQQYEKDRLNREKWRRQKTVTLKLPKSNDLSDKNGFTRAVEDAFDYVRELWPGGLQVTIEGKQARLEQLDPRFEVKLVATDTSERYQMIAKEDVNLKITFSTNKDDPRIGDLHERGLAAAFLPGEVRIEGSDLFKPVEEYGVHIKPHSELAGELNIFAIDQNGTDRSLILAIPAKLRHGRSEGVLEAELPGGLLSLSVDMHFRVNDPLQTRMRVNLAPWYGQPIHNLRYFDHLRSFVRAVSRGTDFAVDFVVDGDRRLAFLVSNDNFSQKTLFNHLTQGKRILNSREIVSC